MAERVAIVGGGAAGTLAAVHLLRAPRGRGTVEIELIDRDGSFGPGVAYGTEDPLHLVSAPAVRMGAVSGHADDFHRWLAARGEPVDEAAFPARNIFGTYLRDLLVAAQRVAPDDRLHCHVGEVVRIAERHGPTTASLELTFADGRRLEADRVVLAPGPLSGSDPVTVPAKLRADGTYVADPWTPGALEAARRERSVLIIGTGLTMVDVALTLCTGGHGPQVRAVSRHGLLPRSHRRELTRLRRFHLPRRGLDAIAATVLEQIARVSRQGDDWRDVIDSMLPVTPRLWAALEASERRRFLAELHRLWDVHRFRMAPEVAERIAALSATGSLRTEAGTIVSLEAHGAGARVYIRTPGARELDRLDVDRVINCSGAGAVGGARLQPLLAGLLSSGHARPDELGLGLDIDPDGSLLDAGGSPSDRLFLVGPLRRGVEWEAVGIPEIRDQASAVASRIAALAARPGISKAPPAARVQTIEEAAA